MRKAAGLASQTDKDSLRNILSPMGISSDQSESRRVNQAEISGDQFTKSCL
jgi:DnaJ-domain-containing protein 1